MLACSHVQFLPSSYADVMISALTGKQYTFNNVNYTLTLMLNSSPGSGTNSRLLCIVSGELHKGISCMLDLRTEVWVIL